MMSRRRRICAAASRPAPVLVPVGNGRWPPVLPDGQHPTADRVNLFDAA